MNPKGPSLPVHAWRALHSGLVDEVLRQDGETCLAVTDKLGGLGWIDFGEALRAQTLRARVVGVTLDDAWIALDFAHEPGQYRPALMMRTKTLGVDAEPLIRAHADDLGVTVDELLGDA